MQSPTGGSRNKVFGDVDLLTQQLRGHLCFFTF
jgi:hypothetical protein